MFNFTLLLIITAIICVLFGFYIYYYTCKDCDREIRRIEIARIARERRYYFRQVHPEFLSNHYQPFQTQQYIKEIPEIIVIQNPDNSMQIAELITD